MNFSQFNQYVEDKYDDINGIHHYEVAQESGDTSIKIWVENDSDTNAYSGATAITNYEHELAEQDRKRKIRLLDDRYLGLFVSEFEKRIKESII